jgi:surfactin synthase thioesterase subunit
VKLADRYLVIERPEASLRVLFLHHGGGSAMSLLTVARRLPMTSEPVLFELPGRGMRAGQPVAPDFAAALEDATAAAKQCATRPLVIVGQSLGGLLAHGLSARLTVAGDADVRAVVVASCAAPSVIAASASRPDKPFQVRSRSEVEQQLRDGGGCDPEIFAEPDFLAAAVELLGNDLHLADTYHAPVSAASDSVKYHVWSGSHDPDMTPEKLIGWQEATPRPPVFRQFPGGHFLLTDDQPQAALHDLLARQAGCSVTGSIDRA